MWATNHASAARCKSVAREAIDRVKLTPLEVAASATVIAEIAREIDDGGGTCRHGDGLALPWRRVLN